jgi:hypothetical protein
MAYYNQEQKRELAPVIKGISKKYNIKCSLSVQNHSTICCVITSGEIDFIKNYNDNKNDTTQRFDPKAVDNIRVNHYWFREHFSGVAQQCIAEIIDALRGPKHYDNSDVQSDYFECSHYISLSVGRWDKPYQLLSK